MKKIIYISGTRADFGLMKSTLHLINKNSLFDLKIIVTGMHLMEEFGNTINEIEKENFNIEKINVVYQENNHQGMSIFLADFLKKLIENLKEEKPDLILILGDRAEALAGAIAGHYMMIPVIHLHGGELSSTVDDATRHAITKLAHIHLVATKNSAKRIIKMGEEKFRVNVVGAPGLDSILNINKMSKKEIFSKFNLDITKKTCLLIYHPVSLEADDSEKQMKIILESLKELEIQSVVIYPNADAGSKGIIRILDDYDNKDLFQIHKNINHELFVSLLSSVNFMIGNSSSGIIESASFKIPAINIGSRQDGRERTKNVINVNCDKLEIKAAIQNSLNLDLSELINPYGTGIAGKKIIKFLEKLETNKKVLQKKMSY
jgi:UDP-hydrolysing UDP-N-acetyl-D-glucosamine 2-epimerase